MTLRNAFEEMATEATSADIRALADSMVFVLQAMLEKMPRVDKTDRLTMDMTDYAIGGNSYTSSMLTSINNPVNGANYSLLQAPAAMYDAGTARIYQNIIVSA